MRSQKVARPEQVPWAAEDEEDEEEEGEEALDFEDDEDVAADEVDEDALEVEPLLDEEEEPSLSSSSSTSAQLPKMRHAAAIAAAIHATALTHVVRHRVP